MDHIERTNRCMETAVVLSRLLNIQARVAGGLCALIAPTLNTQADDDPFAKAFPTYFIDGNKCRASLRC